jgi:hypothetical protein
MDWLDALTLPAGTHAAVLTGRDVVSGEQLAYPVVWADRAYAACPLCGQPVARVVEECPVLLDTGACQGGRIEEWSKQHGCGEWLPVDWDQVPAGDPVSDVTEDDVVAAARMLAARLAGAITAERGRIRERLLAELRDVLRRLAEPLEDGETSEDRAEQVGTASEASPGVYEEDGEWIAWDYDPAGNSETIAVDASDLAAQVPGD